MDENHTVYWYDHHMYRFWYDYQWYEIHTFFGMLSVKSEIVPILVRNSYHCF